MAVTKVLTQYESERNKPIPNFIHGVIQTQICFLLKSKYGKRYLFPGELSLATNPGSTPDICIYPRKKLNILTTEAKESKAPITTIEIQSPSQSIDELVIKAYNLYFPMGVQSAWIVIPALKSIQVILPKDPDILFSKGRLKDPITRIEIDLEKVFEDLE